jgi:xylulokinase
MGTGDQQCGGLGAGCTFSGIGYAALGSGGNIALKSKERHLDSKRQCLVLGAPDCGMVLEGQAQCSGVALKWLLQLLTDQGMLEKTLSQNVRDAYVYEAMLSLGKKSPLGAKGCLFLPYLAGGNTPNYEASAKGAFVGLTLEHTRADLIRSVMEGIAFQAKDMLLAVEESGQSKFSTIRLTGGVGRSDFWNQVQADVLDKVIETVSTQEVPALGAAMIAAVGLGIYGSYQEAADRMVRVKLRYFPNKAEVASYGQLFPIWKSAYTGLVKETFPQLAEFRKK